MRLALIPGHGYRYRRGRFLRDPGAVAGSVEEALWARRLCERVTEMAPHGLAEVFDEPQLGGPLSTYTQRRKAAMRWIGAGPAIVCHVHCNAGGGRYSLAMHDPRSTAGARVAVALSDHLGREAPILSAQQPCRPMAARRSDGWKHAANLLEPTYSEPAGICALLVEWGFVDSPCAPSFYPATLDEMAAALVSLI